jgi:hypothetical protein
LVIIYRNLVAYTEAGIEDERTRAHYVAMIPQMRAWWKAWQGDDSLYEMAFGEPPLEPKRTTLWQWLSLIPISICSPQVIALVALIMAIIIALSAIRWLLWLAGVPTG